MSLTTTEWSKMILCKEVPVPIAGLALALWAFIQVADAYDSCDVRHRFMPETRKNYLFFVNKGNQFMGMFILVMNVFFWQ